MIDGTRRVLEAFPDRLLLADDVIWSGCAEKGYYSSHRIVSPMTNDGPSAYGPPTGKRVWTLTIADCIVEGGRITREYLLRDHYSLVNNWGSISDGPRSKCRGTRAGRDGGFGGESPGWPDAGAPATDFPLRRRIANARGFAEGFIRAQGRKKRCRGPKPPMPSTLRVRSPVSSVRGGNRSRPTMRNCARPYPAATCRSIMLPGNRWMGMGCVSRSDGP